jgi:NAD(P)-dependent dehydrogenase (short-subunit alcohol dehydrogenase family)
MSSAPASNLNGKVVAITGAARGIGAATARSLHEAGARVAIGDIDHAEAEKTAAALGEGVLPLELDVTDAASLQRFLDAVETELGPLDVLVNNAGIMPLSRLLDEPDEVTARVFDINVLAMIRATREAVRRMQPRGRGHVVIVASTAGKAGVPGASTYCASKHAMVGFAEALNAELADTPIEISCVMPGIVRTELTQGVADMPGFRAITPDLVADAIRDAIAEPRFEVFVPRSAGPLLRSTRMMPRRTSTWIAKKMGTDRVFLDAIDSHGRDEYESRARGKRSR